MTIVGLDHVQVAAPPGCERDARRFYGGVLGLVEVEKPEPLAARGGVWFALGSGSGQQLHVGVSDDFVPALKAHPGLTVTGGSLETLADRLVEAGCDVRWDSSLPGVARFYVDDPWGNRLELVSTPTAAGPS